jgi:5'-phosphate synthase pdxT subunit
MPVDGPRRWDVDEKGDSPCPTIVIGVLALQGDFAEHQQMLQRLGADVELIKHARQLKDVDGLIIPGGESTTIAKLTATSDTSDCIFEAIAQRARDGMPVYGTCMGTILLAKYIEGSAQGRLALMDITVRRNAFGPQKFSRQQLLPIAALGSQPFNLVFIRGPVITGCGGGVHVLARVDEGIVMAMQANLLVTAFHPELTDDTRVHRYFLQMVADYKSSSGERFPALVAATATPSLR